MKEARKHTIKFNRAATLYLNMLVDKIISDFITSCEAGVSKKTNEKTYTWKSFNPSAFQTTFSHSLMLSSSYYVDFVNMRN